MNEEWCASSTGSQVIPNLGECRPHRMLKGRAATVGTRQEWAARNLVRFEKGKYQVLHLGQKNPTYLLDSKLNLSQQHALRVEVASCILGGVSKNGGRMLREVVCPLWSVLLGPHLERCVQF